MSQQVYRVTVYHFFDSKEEAREKARSCREAGLIAMIEAVWCDGQGETLAIKKDVSVSSDSRDASSDDLDGLPD